MLSIKKDSVAFLQAALELKPLEVVFVETGIEYEKSDQTK